MIIEVMSSLKTQRGSGYLCMISFHLAGMELCSDGPGEIGLFSALIHD